MTEPTTIPAIALPDKPELGGGVELFEAPAVELVVAAVAELLVEPLEPLEPVSWFSGTL